MTKVVAGKTLQEVVLVGADGSEIGAANPIPVALGATPTIDIGDVTLLAGSATIGAVTSPTISVASAISGQVTVTTAGTSVQGGNVALTNGVYIKALTGNTGNMFIGYATGDNRDKFELDANQLIYVPVSNLNQLWFDASVNGEKVCWLKA